MHPNIVNVYDVGEDRGLYYIVMELVEGITLKDYIEKKEILSARAISRLPCTILYISSSSSILLRPSVHIKIISPLLNRYSKKSGAVVKRSFAGRRDGAPGGNQ